MWASNGAHIRSVKCIRSHRKTVKETCDGTLKFYSISPSVSHILSFRHVVNGKEMFGILCHTPCWKPAVSVTRMAQPALGSEPATCSASPIGQ